MSKKGLHYVFKKFGDVVDVKLYRVPASPNFEEQQTAVVHYTQEDGVLNAIAALDDIYKFFDDRDGPVRVSVEPFIPNYPEIIEQESDQQFRVQDTPAKPVPKRAVDLKPRNEPKAARSLLL